MCGIIGAVSEKSISGAIIDGLKSLEYRGYDSSGIAVIYKNQAILEKQVGRVDLLDKEVSGNIDINKASIGIGHTRWATHGDPSIINAHPHKNSDGSIFVVHNGIIENYKELRKDLEDKGYQFISQTDTEVIPHLIDYYVKQNMDFNQAFMAAVNDLTGAFAIAAIYTKTPNTLYAARLSSPLIIGLGEGKNYVASDPSAIVDHTKKRQ